MERFEQVEQGDGHSGEESMANALARGKHLPPLMPFLHPDHRNAP